MVGLAVGPAAIAGIALATVYWQFANSFAVGLANASISQVSQRYGAGQYGEIDTAVKQTIVVVIMLPFVAVYFLFSQPLIALVTSEAPTIRHGSVYLRVLSLALLLNVANYVFSRTLAGADDTQIAMSVRATGALVNVVINAILIFGLGMGVLGAAIGTIVAETVVATTLAWGFFTGSLPVLGAFPVTATLSGPYFDRGMARELGSTAPPLIFDRLARAFARFPLFAILAMFGPITVAAYEVARRIRTLMEATSKGFSMAASGLVGQELGRDDEPEADRFAWDIIRFSTVMYVVSIVLVLLFADPLSHFFADDPQAVSQTVPFVRIAAISFLGSGLSQSLSGILKGAGDNRWIFYARIVSQYLVLIPLAYVGATTSLGLLVVYVAILAEAGTRASIIGYRFTSGNWKVVSRSHRPKLADD
jgi:putative MATE family efflux protein